MANETLPVILVSTDGNLSDDKGIFPPRLEDLARKVDVPLDNLRANVAHVIRTLASLADDSADASPGGLRLSEVSVSLDISADGGVRLVGSATIGLSGGITLTFVRS